MFDKRPFLFGLGVGIISGALLLQLMLVAGQQPGRTDQLDRLTGEAGNYTQAEVDELVAAAEQRVRGELEIQGERRAVDGGTVQNEAPAGDRPSDTVTPAASPGTVRVDKLPVRIRPGMTLGQVAAHLKSKGVLAEEKVFLALMSDWSKEIVAGFYYFDGEISPADVKRIITSPPFDY
ncbi:hypothetical protein BG53_11810 [Paenibacillus darwinianus]|uniref:Uncharacterized protein n=1 Tax=Paenibacillus darwinianus TaxID=1380763 RepID=A0A9W5W8J4_9BACL|nr:hypothetical protein [Paenibacillus darwinianus]EXX91275.1 hypothetical protein BG53_11810 [Paenibacillus darwinianus]EXX92219.1 hypothetical protein BG52_15210 [Paenibacillus darwinianus]EXX92823.1 hypothetical protein CH50_12115 [Paenibacillus darwinianus]